jgi:hypothetical protein
VFFPPPEQPAEPPKAPEVDGSHPEVIAMVDEAIKEAEKQPVTLSFTKYEIGSFVISYISHKSILKIIKLSKILLRQFQRKINTQQTSIRHLYEMTSQQR